MAYHRAKRRLIFACLAGILLSFPLASCARSPSSAPSGAAADASSQSRLAEDGALSTILERIETAGLFASGAALPGAWQSGLPQSEMQRFWLEAAFPAAAKLGILAASALICLALYLLKPHFREFLACSAYAASLLALAAIRDHAFLPFALPAGIPLGRIGLIAAALHAAALLMLCSALFPSWASSRVRMICYVAAFLAGLVAAIPPIAFSLAFLAQTALLALAYTAIAAGLLRLSLKREPGALAFLAALAGAAALFAARLLSELPAIALLIADSAGLLVLASSALLMLQRRSGEAFAETELQNAEAVATESSAQRFIPKEFLDQLKKGAVSELKLGDHVRRVMTIFFSDIRSFTELSEKLTPEENFRFVNSYLARMVPVIKERGGFVDKYIGDAIMALFPGDHASDDAVGTAVEMQRRVIEYNGHRASVGYSPIAMGVGLHTGDLMLGVVGVDDRMENTVVSDAVNLASRLQAIAKAFNLGIVISEQCFKTLSDPGAYHYRFIGKVRVKGKAAPVSVFEILDGLDEATFDRKMRANTYFEQGMIAYYGKDYAAAMFHFREALELIPEDGAVRFYLETCMNRARQEGLGGGDR